jgi:amino acid transporter
VQGSTLTNIIINVIQIAALLTFSVLAIIYRLTHPHIQYLHPNALSVIMPHDLGGLVFQSTIAILLVVGFESATALAAEAKNPGRDIPRGVLLSLVIQAVICYFFEYFAANFAINDSTKFTGTTSTGFAGANASVAPIGDIAHQIGDAILRGNGLAFAIILACTVVLALLGTSLSCLNTGVRVTYAMGKDTELPVIFGFLHGKFRTPHMAVIVLTVISAAIGSYGVLNVNTLTQVTLMSNIGTFLLYGMTCVTCIIAFAGVKGRGWFTTIVAPGLGAVMNVLMLIGVCTFDITAGNTSTFTEQTDTIIALAVAAAWLVIGFGYLYYRKVAKGIPMLHPPDHKETLDESVTASTAATD